MNYRLEINDERLWHKDCSKIPRDDLNRMIEKIQQLKAFPWVPGLDVSLLRDYHLADYRLRSGSYRVLFCKDDKKQVITLIRVLHRSKLY